MATGPAKEQLDAIAFSPLPHFKGIWCSFPAITDFELTLIPPQKMYWSNCPRVLSTPIIGLPCSSVEKEQEAPFTSTLGELISGCLYFRAKNGMVQWS